jgi:hypothetical protein
MMASHQALLSAMSGSTTYEATTGTEEVVGIIIQQMREGVKRKAINC